MEKKWSIDVIESDRFFLYKNKNEKLN